MTRKTYCGNLLWQSGLTLLAPVRVDFSPKRAVQVTAHSHFLGSATAGFPVRAAVRQSAAPRNVAQRRQSSGSITPSVLIARSVFGMTYASARHIPANAIAAANNVTVVAFIFLPFLCKPESSGTRA